MAGHIELMKAASMTSQEIGDLVDSRHDSVCRTILRLVGRGIIALPPMVDKPTAGRTASQYLFSGDQGKRDCLVVVAQLSPEFTGRVVDRWQELENKHSKPALPDFTNPAESARAWAFEYEQKQVLQIENQQQAEKIESLESLFREGMTPTQFCKLLNGVNVMAINSYLLDRNWLYNESKKGTRWRTASYARDLYLTEHQSEITPHGQNAFIKYTPVLLRKGAARLHELYIAGKLPMKKSWDGKFTHDKPVAVTV